MYKDSIINVSYCLNIYQYIFKHICLYNGVNLLFIKIAVYSQTSKLPDLVGHTTYNTLNMSSHSMIENNSCINVAVKSIGQLK